MKTTNTIALSQGAPARILPGAVSTKIRAIACGFKKSAYLCNAFHSETGDSVAASPKPSAFLWP